MQPKIAVRRLPHAEGLPLPAYETPGSAGMDLRAAVPEGDSHQVTSENGMATVRPSIAVCDAPCKSHYYITAGQIEWLPAFSETMAASVMRGQIVRHALHDQKPQSWATRFGNAILKVFNMLRAFLRI